MDLILDLFRDSVRLGKRPLANLIYIKAETKKQIEKQKEEGDKIELVSQEDEL